MQWRARGREGCGAADHLHAAQTDADGGCKRRRLARASSPACSPARGRLAPVPPPQLLHEAEKKLKMASRKDYYSILGVARDADIRDVKKAYKKAAVAHHPDKAPVAERAAAEDKFKEVRQMGGGKEGWRRGPLRVGEAAMRPCCARATPCRWPCNAT